jgi:Flp pilus assembly protein TadD
VLLNKLYEFNSVLLIAFVSLFLFSLTSDLNQFPSTLAEKSSDNINTLINKALALDNLGNYTQAIQYLNKALAIDPKDVDVLNNKGSALGRLGDHTQAIQYFDKALDIEPRDVKALGNKALDLYRLGNCTQAIQYYNKALDIDPRYVAALGNKGLALDTQACKASRGY